MMRRFCIPTTFTMSLKRSFSNPQHRSCITDFGWYAKPQDEIITKVVCCCFGSLVFGWIRLCVIGEMVC